MTRYTLLSSNRSEGRNSQESRQSQERDLEDPDALYKPPSLTDSQRQLVGLLVFVWMFFLYVTLRFMVSDNNAAILPDLLTRILEAIAILGPENCHLSIVESGTTDNSRRLLEFTAKFLKDHNARLDLSQANVKHSKQDPATNTTTSESVDDSLRKIEFTLVTLGASDRSAHEDSNAYWSRLRKRVLEPLTLSTSQAISGAPPRPPFDRVVFIQEALTCADDILEMVYQSHLQDAEMTCGMTWLSVDQEKSDLSLKTGQALRDILGVPLAVPLNSMSTDKDTMHRFQMRQPFQVTCCDWRQGAVIRADILMQQEQQQQQQQQREQPPSSEELSCVGQDVALQLCAQISQWRNTSVASANPSPPHSASQELPPPSSDGMSDTIEKQGDQSGVEASRIVIVPQVVWVPGEKEYELLETLDAEGQWSRTDQEHRDDIEERLIRATYQHTYGYRKSAKHYKYVAPRPAVETGNGDNGPKEDNAGNAKQTQQHQNKGDKSDILQQVQTAGTYEHSVESRLARSKVTFGVQDIEQDNVIKATKAQVATWRLGSLCPQQVPKAL
ncbi:capsular associated protein [Actinomortierella wolfii]|nr:capsular associated protein [Actinomortierella wolfii]